MYTSKVSIIIVLLFFFSCGINKKNSEYEYLFLSKELILDTDTTYKTKLYIDNKIISIDTTDSSYIVEYFFCNKAYLKRDFGEKFLDFSITKSYEDSIVQIKGRLFLPLLKRNFFEKKIMEKVDDEFKPLLKSGVSSIDFVEINTKSKRITFYSPSNSLKLLSDTVFYEEKVNYGIKEIIMKDKSDTLEIWYVEGLKQGGRHFYGVFPDSSFTLFTKKNKPILQFFTATGTDYNHLWKFTYRDSLLVKEEKWHDVCALSDTLTKPSKQQVIYNWTCISNEEAEKILNRIGYEYTILDSIEYDCKSIDYIIEQSNYIDLLR